MRGTLWFLVAFLVALLLAEIGARALGLRVPPRQRFEMTSLRLMVPESNAPGLGRMNRPGSTARAFYIDAGSDSERIVDYEISKQGLRDREFSHAKPADVLRVVVLGDSITFGVGVQQEETFSKVMERELAGRFPKKKIEVINAGIWATNTSQQIAWLKYRMLRFDPDLVFICSTLVDIRPPQGTQKPRTTPEDRWIRRLGLSSGIVENEVLERAPASFHVTTPLRRHSALVDYMIYKLHYILRSRSEESIWIEDWADGSPGVEAIRSALTEGAELSREHDFDLHVGMFPFLSRLNENYPFQEQHGHLERICRDLGLPFHDLIEPLLGESGRALMTHVHDHHPGVRAHRLVGEWLAVRLEEPLGF